MIDTISVRVPLVMKEELNQFAKDEKLEQISEAARKLLFMGLEEWRRKRALELLAAGKITLSKGAKLAKMDIWNFADLVKKKKAAWIKEKRFIEEDIKKRVG